MDQALTGITELTETVKGVVAENVRLKVEVEKVKAAPAPMPTPAAGSQEHSRGGPAAAGAGGGTAEEQLVSLVERMGGVQALGHALTKMAQAQPMQAG